MATVDTVCCNNQSSSFPHAVNCAFCVTLKTKLLRLSAEPAVRVRSGEGTGVAENCSHQMVKQGEQSSVYS